MPQKKNVKKEVLNKKAFGLSLGVICSISILIFSLWIIFIGTGQEIINLISKFYIGYSSGFFGTILGMIYGFVDGFIGGWVFAWLYNKFA
ncbi:bacteriophage holin [Candidatus Pacearchaeota archaeon]|nr:bacteriophage holin [Candidatus Pacearchaeota archaeon]